MIFTWLTSISFWLRKWRIALFITLFCLGCVGFSAIPIQVRAQSATDIKQTEDQVIREFALPRVPERSPVYRPRPATQAAPVRPQPRQAQPKATPRRAAPAAPAAASAPRPAAAAAAPAAPVAAPPVETSQYVWEFKRSPVVGNRLRLEGIYPKTQLDFTKPRNWQIKSAKAIVRFRQSPTLLGNRSNLTLRVNDTSIGSKALDRSDSTIGQAEFDIPAGLIYDQNSLTFLAEQQTEEDCTNPNDPGLWTEILPDSKLVFNYVIQPVSLNFSRYPYPIVDEFSLEPNQVSYLEPQTPSSSWLTSISRFQTEMGHLMDYRPLKTRIVEALEDVKPDEKLIVIGTPAEQPILANLALPYPLQNGRFLDGQQQPLPDDIGILMLTTSNDSDTPILIATGNAAEGVSKAIQFLVQPNDRQIGTGQALTVNSLEDLPSPDPRIWSGYLPSDDQFELSALTMPDRQPFSETTVRGSNAPAVQIPFRALPGDRILRGSTMTLHYSHSTQVNPKTSAVEVTLDDIALGAKPLNSSSGEGTLTVDLLDNLPRPNSMITVRFLLQPREGGVCGLEADQQLWGTVHGDSSFNLVRNTVVQLPDLKLLTAGYPLTAPQDLSSTAVVLPDNPTQTEVQTLLNLSERLGRISQADSVKIQAYLARDLNETVKREQHIVTIGRRDRLPLSENLKAKGFDLGTAFLRQFGGSSVQALPDQEGVIKSVLSPWNSERVLLALTGQTEQGLKDIQDLLTIDRLFGQMQGDTTVISRNMANPSPYDTNGYSLQFFQEAPTQRTIARMNVLNRMVIFFQDNWWLIPIVTIIMGLLLYSFSQIFLNRVADSGDL